VSLENSAAEVFPSVDSLRISRLFEKPSCISGDETDRAIAPELGDGRSVEDSSSTFQEVGIFIVNHSELYLVNHHEPLHHPQKQDVSNNKDSIKTIVWDIFIIISL